MKKISSIILSLFVVIVLSGCQKSQILSCEASNNSDGIETTQEYEFKFVGEKLSNAEIKMIMDFEDETNYDTYAEMLDSSFAEQEDFKNVEGLTIDTKSKKPVYTVTMTMDFDKLKDNSKLDELGLNISEDDLKLTIDELKEQIEDSGLTCKIK